MLRLDKKCWPHPHNQEICKYLLVLQLAKNVIDNVVGIRDIINASVEVAFCKCTHVAVASVPHNMGYQRYQLNLYLYLYLELQYIVTRSGHQISGNTRCDFKYLQSFDPPYNAIMVLRLLCSNMYVLQDCGHNKCTMYIRHYCIVNILDHSSFWLKRSSTLCLCNELRNKLKQIELETKAMLVEPTELIGTVFNTYYKASSCVIQ